MSPLTEESLAALVARIVPVSDAIVSRVQARLDDKTKPRGSLGKLEALACRYCAARGRDSGEALHKTLVVMAADHGVARDGVSAFPQAVTRQMVVNFANGGAAINVLARRAAAQLIVVDMGVVEPTDAAPGVRQARTGPGTRSFLDGPAMNEGQALEALQVGIALADELAVQGTNLIGLGEMGIGNTTSASALIAALTGAAAADVTGRGTGVDDHGLRRKIEVVERGLALHRSRAATPLGALAALGGFEIAGLAGLVLGAAARRIPVLVDGLITAAAALVAGRLAPVVTGYLIAAHRSVEPGHVRALDALGLEPLLALDMRLGEGSGAALAMPLVEAALAVLEEMATFSSAGVSEHR